MSSRARAVSFHEPNGKKVTDAELDEIYERMQKRGLLVPQIDEKKERRVVQQIQKVIKDVTRGK